MTNDNTLDAATKITYAKTWLMVHHPFFGGFLATFKFEEDSNIPKFAVSSDTIKWNRSFVENTPLNEIRAILLHEVFHVVFRHLGRLRSYYDKLRANLAADYVVNYYVDLAIKRTDAAPTTRDGCKLPQGAFLDHAYDNMAMEQVYKLLPDDCSNLVDPEDAMDQHVPDNGDGSEEDQDVMKRMVKVWNGLNDTQKQSAIGNMPEDVREALETFNKPKIDFRKYIAETVQDLLKKTDYTFSPRSYNYMAIDEDGFYPRLAGQANKILVVVADTSGSVSQEWLEQFAAEMSGVIKLADRTILMTNDADIHEVEDASQFSEILKMLRMRGGGGTDFRPPFNWIEENHIKPECLIFMTDGWGPFPEKDPGYPVIWGSIPGTAAKSEYPVWSKSQVVELEMSK